MDNETESKISSVISKMELVEIRNSKGMTQKDVADISGLSVKCISDIENNRGNPTFRSLQRYLNALGYEMLFREKTI